MTRFPYFQRRLALCVLFVVAAGAFAEDVRVDRDELATIGDQSIKFINYVGPHEFTNTLDQIRDIGRALGDQIDVGRSSRASVGGGKYRVLHIVSPEIPELLDADVFILGEDAAVDHINNLRTIVAGYLETAYGYTAREAYTVAEFVSYYNAVYRGDINMAMERYKQPVVDALDENKMGIDTHYSQWPGKTQMLIPLRLASLQPGSKEPRVDTGVVSDEKVIDEMRKEEDMGLDTRKDMVDVREDEIDREQAVIDEQKEDVAEREQQVEEELSQLEEKEAADELTTEEKQRQEDLQEEKTIIEKEKVEVEKAQKDLDKRTDEVLEMRDEIAEDENERIGRKDEVTETFSSAEVIKPVWFLMVDDFGNGIPFGRVLKYNLDDGTRLAVSQVTAVRGRTMAVLPESLLVIAGKEGGNSKVRLMLLDRDSLETLKEGRDDVFPGSLMTVKGAAVYLVTTNEGEWRLGRFNTALDRVAVSQVAVEPWTSISFDGNSLFVQGKKGNIYRLSAATLEVEADLE